MACQLNTNTNMHKQMQFQAWEYLFMSKGGEYKTIFLPASLWKSGISDDHLK